MSRHLVITADDFGYCDNRNKAIAEAYLTQSITRASLLVNATYAKQAAKLAIQHNIPIGLHLNLTEGLPVLELHQIPSLIGTDGTMLGKLGFRERLKAGKIKFSEIKLEVEAQIQLFKVITGKVPYYVDGHQHVHVLPGICDIFAKALEENGVGSTRLPLERSVDDCNTIPEPSRSFYKEVVKDSQKAALVYKKHNLRFSQGFVGMTTMGRHMSPDGLRITVMDAFTTLQEELTHALCIDKLPCTLQCICDRHNQKPPCFSIDKRTKTKGEKENDRNDNEADKIHAINSKEGIEAPQSCHDRKSRTINCDHGSNEMDDKDRTGTPIMEVELMTHPGYPCVDPTAGCGCGPDEFARSGDREHELQVLMSKDLHIFYRENSIQLCKDFYLRETKA